MRYLTEYLKRDFTKKMILLSGPRQTGKTTLAKQLVGEKGVYLNWDILSDQRIIRNMAWPKEASLVVLDELHKYTKWKNFLKGLADEFQNKPPLLVTGSAKIETFRHEGDALTGRYFSYRLHPIDLAESKLFFETLSCEERLDRLLKTGGFPEAFLAPDEAERLRNDRFDLVIQEDLRDLSKTSSIRGIKLLIELLRERVGGQVSYSNLSKDLGVTPATVKSWIELLQSLYTIFIVPPYHTGLARSLRKEPKFYFYDCASAYGNDNQGAILENAVGCSLLKYCNFQRDVYGKQMELFYFRDREKREVDFVVTLARKVHWCLEVKTSDDNLSPNLEYLHKRLNPLRSFQLVKNISKPKEIRGIKIVSLAAWLDDIGF